MLNGAYTPRDPAAIADNRHRLVAKREGDKDAVDSILQYRRHGVVVLGSDDEICVSLRNLLVPRSDERRRVSGIVEVTHCLKRFGKHRQWPVAKVKNLDLEPAVVLGTVDNPLSDQVGSPTRTGTSN